MEKNQGKNQKWLKIAIIVLVVTVAYDLVTWCIDHSKGQDEVTVTEEQSGNIGIDSESMDITDENYEKAQPKEAFFTCTGYSDMEVKTGNAVYLKNNADNVEYDIFEKYEIYSDDGEMIFASELIEPGKQIEFIPSDYLPKGSYVITIVQTPYIYNNATEQYDAKFSGSQNINLAII